MAYRAERVALPTAEADVVRLWRENLSFGFDPALKYRWFYSESPCGSADVFLLLHEAGRDTRAVGCAGLGRRRLWHRGTPLSASLPADLAVDRAHRLLAPALMLQRAVREHATRTSQLCYAFPNSHAAPVMERAGYKRLGRFRRYVRPLDAGSLADARAAAGVVPWLLRRGVARAARVAAGLRRPVRTILGRRFRWLEDIDPGFERLWRARQAESPFVGDRTARFLRWRFLERPGVPSRLVAAYDRAGHPTAYAFLTAKEAGAAFLADFAFSAPLELGILLDFISRELRREGLVRIETHFLGPHRLQRLLVTRGFLPHGTGKWVVVSAGANAPVTEEEALRPEDWFLTDADRDN
ncbi:MAG: hypothetical protein KBA95_03880 [Acidobacteria bacterium]|nr:hypothetical protein [Acidobacteriota bacterium]